MYKILLGNTVVDVQERLQYVMWQEKNKLLLSCDERLAEGILSADNSVAWHLEGLPDMPEEFDTVKAVEISEDKYNELKEKLGTGEKPTEEKPKEEVLESTDLRLKVASLTQEVETLKSNNDMLSDCILEMSEIVYA